MAKEKKTANFHARLTQAQDDKLKYCVEQAPKKHRIRNKSDLFLFMLDCFYEAISAPD